MNRPHVVYQAASSLDGFIADERGGVDWLNAFDSGGEDHGLTAFYESIDAIAMGSHTYEFALAHPPWMMTDRRTWVFTKRELERAHETVTLTAEEPAAVLDEIAHAGGRRVWLMGGGALASSFLEAGCLDEVRIAVVPYVLGRGLSLFARPVEDGRLELVESRPYPTGFVELAYPTRPGSGPSA